MSGIITSLTNRGYAIQKTEDNKEVINKIKSELLISPKSFNNSFATIKEYPIYLESDARLYVPKCYGIEKFGFPLNDNLSFGVDCPNLIFNGKLRVIFFRLLSVAPLRLIIFFSSIFLLLLGISIIFSPLKY